MRLVPGVCVPTVWMIPRLMKLPRLEQPGVTAWLQGLMLPVRMMPSAPVPDAVMPDPVSIRTLPLTVPNSAAMTPVADVDVEPEMFALIIAVAVVVP